MQRLLAVVLMGALAAGCTEVTRVDRPDGSEAWMVDCGNKLALLDSCRGALDRTCPDGWEKVNARIISPQGDRPATQAGVFRCTTTVR